VKERCYSQKQEGLFSQYQNFNLVGSKVDSVVFRRLEEPSSFAASVYVESGLLIKTPEFYCRLLFLWPCRVSSLLIARSKANEGLKWLATQTYYGVDSKSSKKKN
jgi:hypothetical protein